MNGKRNFGFLQKILKLMQSHMIYLFKTIGEYKMEEKINRDLLLMVFKIKRHPNAVLERKSLISLSNFINGFVWGYNYPNVFTAFPGFQNYISKKYSCKLVLSWVNILLIHANNNEEQAFDLFFDELETFMKEKGIKFPNIE